MPVESSLVGSRSIGPRSGAGHDSAQLPCLSYPLLPWPRSLFDFSAEQGIQDQRNGAKCCATTSKAPRGAGAERWQMVLREGGVSVHQGAGRRDLRQSACRHKTMRCWTQTQNVQVTCFDFRGEAAAGCWYRVQGRGCNNARASPLWHN